MSENLQHIYQKLESGFYGFWVKRRRTTFLLILLMVILGLTSAIQIPKESSPTIKFGIVTVITVYPGVNPQDMDTLVTEKIENEVKNVDGIKKISSTSSVGVASTVIELENGVDTTKALSDVKSAVEKVSLPSDAQDPIITEVSSDNERMFSVLLYGKKENFTTELLKEKARKLKKAIDGKGDINKIDIDGTTDYELHVLVSKAKADALGLSLLQISQAISSFNTNQPLGNHSLGDLSYDFRIQGELVDERALMNIPIATNGSFVNLGDIAIVSKKLKDDREIYKGSHDLTGNRAVLIVFNKKPGTNILKTADYAKALLEQELKKQEYAGLQASYTTDLAETISTDYRELAKTATETIILVFLAILLFVGFKEALIGSVTVPLSFFVTFFVLQKLGLSLNFLTNFSLIICFGIAIDATIVVIQGAHEKMRQGFNPKSAVLLSVKDYSIPLISGTLTTVIVFLPMFTLPGIMGKFLAYIPITIFITLVASLFISLTLNSALYYKLTKPHLTYDPHAGDAEHLTPQDQLLLEEERTGKISQNTEELPRRERMLDGIAQWYTKKVAWIMKSPQTRIIAILSPLVCLILSFFFLSPFIGFNLFPSGDSEYMYFTFTAKKGTTVEKMEQMIDGVDPVLASFSEVKNYYFVVDKNTVDVTVRLVDREDRKKDSFAIEKELNNKLVFLSSRGLKVESKVEGGGPPSGKAVGLKLIADSNEKFPLLIQVAKDFEKYLKTVEGVKNVGVSSADSPGQFVLRYNLPKLAILGIKPTDLNIELYAITNGIGAGSFKGKYDDHNIKVKYRDFNNGLTPSDVQGISVPTMAGKINMGSVSNYSFENAVSQISREDTKIVVNIDADLQDGYSSVVPQSQFTQFASTYKFPAGISYQAGGENEENADLVQAMVIAFIVALFLIFLILVLQFNSYTQSLLILYSIVMGLFGANIGLFITNNPYSLSFMIGFIALTGIVVNHVIVLIDRININLDKGMSMYDALIETGKSRLHPVLLTTVSTVVGLFSIVRQDKFFAGLGYTIIFGLLVATIMTLFVIPALYHDKEKIISLIKRTILSFVVWLALPFIGILIVIMFFMFFGVNLFSYSWFGGFVGIIYVIYIIGYQLLTLKRWKSSGQSILQRIFKERVVTVNGKLLSKKQAMRRLLIRRGLLLAPFVAAGMLSGLLALVGADGLFGAFAFLFFMGYVFWNIYILWTSEYNQFLHDVICKTKIEEGIAPTDDIVPPEITTWVHDRSLNLLQEGKKQGLPLWKKGEKFGWILREKGQKIGINLWKKLEKVFIKYLRK